MKAKAAQIWPLWAILAAQEILTLPWLWRTAPFSDEALYIDAGHQEWAHWLHHTHLAGYASWFSGAPVLYPPLGAAADSLGGLAGARALSLVLMLGATGLVYGTTARLFGRTAGFLGAALYGLCGIVVHYGAFATFNALALFFLVLATWAAVHVRDGGYRWIAACVAALAIANIAKYATLAWDPVIICIVVLHGWETGRLTALWRGLLVTFWLVAVDVGMLALGGAPYIRGVSATTVFRTIHWASPSSASSVFWRAGALTGLLVLPAFFAVVISAARRQPLASTGLLAVLALASLVAPIDQARIHQLPALDKNIGFGLSFAAIAAGYTLYTCIRWAGDRFPTGRAVAGAAAGALILLVLIAGREQSVQFRGPSMSVAIRLVSTVSRDYQRGTFIISDGGSRMEQYYLPDIPERAWLGLFNPTPAQRSRFRDQICAGHVSLVLLRLASGTYEHPYDYQIRAMLGTAQRYRLATAAGAGNYETQVWQLEPPIKKGSCR